MTALRLADAGPFFGAGDSAQRWTGCTTQEQAGSEEGVNTANCCQTSPSERRFRTTVALAVLLDSQSGQLGLCGQPLPCHWPTTFDPKPYLILCENGRSGTFDVRGWPNASPFDSGARHHSLHLSRSFARSLRDSQGVPIFGAASEPTALHQTLTMTSTRPCQRQASFY